MIDSMAAHRFPPPRSIDETDACFIVKDRAGQALAYVYDDLVLAWLAAHNS